MRLSVRISWIATCLIYFLLIVVECSVGEKTVPFCLLKCKDEHMMKMDSEWSMDFAFPLLSLLRTNGSEEAAYLKATQICFHNEMLGVCIDKCNASDEREIMQIGLEPWNKICSNLRTLRTQFSCWKFHIETLTLACFVESHRLRMSLRQLTFSNNLANVNSVCQQMQILASCTVDEYGKQCGVVTTKLLASLFDSAPQFNDKNAEQEMDGSTDCLHSKHNL
ncbi:Protein fantom [Aphelenchoides bicaudatus]|nr:Protein fantom [Aphelenchoides bicaudatus]